MSEQTKLSTKQTVADFRKMELARDRVGISELIRLRLSERYVAPVVRAPKDHCPVEDSKGLSEETTNAYGSQQSTSGFAQAAFACLLIETIQCFRDGLRDTKRRGAGLAAYERFFQIEAERLGNLAGKAKEVYEEIRCGILHQGETYKGWLLSQRGPLFDAGKKRINGLKLLMIVDRGLCAYCDQLSVEDWDSVTWINCRRKMEEIIRNCHSAL